MLNNKEKSPYDGMDYITGKRAANKANETLPRARIGNLHDKAMRQSQAQLTRVETLREVKDWLLKRYKLGWIAHNEIPCPEPEVFDLVFYKSDIELLDKGELPQR